MKRQPRIRKPSGARPRRLAFARARATGPAHGPSGCTHAARPCEGCEALVETLKGVLERSNEVLEAIEAELGDALQAGEKPTPRVMVLADARGALNDAVWRVVESVKNGAGAEIEADLSLLSVAVTAWELAFNAGVDAGILSAETDAKHEQADRGMQAAEDDADDADQGPVDL